METPGPTALAAANFYSRNVYNYFPVMEAEPHTVEMVHEFWEAEAWEKLVEKFVKEVEQAGIVSVSAETKLSRGEEEVALTVWGNSYGRVLIHHAESRLPDLLRDMLYNPEVIKIGRNVKHDCQKILRARSDSIQPWVDTQELTRQYSNTDLFPHRVVEYGLGGTAAGLFGQDGYYKPTTIQRFTELFGGIPVTWPKWRCYLIMYNWEGACDTYQKLYLRSNALVPFALVSALACYSYQIRPGVTVQSESAVVRTILNAYLNKRNDDWFLEGDSIPMFPSFPLPEETVYSTRQHREKLIPLTKQEAGPPLRMDLTLDSDDSSSSSTPKRARYQSSAPGPSTSHTLGNLSPGSSRSTLGRSPSPEIQIVQTINRGIQEYLLKREGKVPGCLKCGNYQHRYKHCPVRQPECCYPLCGNKRSHIVKVCPTLHGTCPQCNLRGHGAENCQGINLHHLSHAVQLFEQYANLGKVTKNRHNNPRQGAFFLGHEVFHGLHRTVEYEQLLTEHPHDVQLWAKALIRGKGPLFPVRGKRRTGPCP